MKFSYDHHQSLGYLTGLASRLLNNRLALRFQEAGIDMTAEQWGALLVLLNGDAMTQGQLGEQLGLEKSSVSRLTDGLEKRGWIIRIRDSEDSRKKLVSPTQEARETATHCEVIARSVLDEAQQNMTDEQQYICRSHLSLVIANLQGLT